MVKHKTLKRIKRQKQARKENEKLVGLKIGMIN
jgi:hypothetical protein